MGQCETAGPTCDSTGLLGAQPFYPLVVSGTVVHILETPPATGLVTRLLVTMLDPPPVPAIVDLSQFTPGSCDPCVWLQAGVDLSAPDPLANATTYFATGGTLSLTSFGAAGDLLAYDLHNVTLPEHAGDNPVAGGQTWCLPGTLSLPELPIKTPDADGCDLPGVLTLDDVIVGDTTAGSDRFHDPSVCFVLGAGDGANDQVYEFTAPVAGAYTVEVFPEDAAYDPVIYVLEACTEGAISSCYGAGDLTGAGETESVTVPLSQGQTVYVVVDGWAANTSSPYLLSVSETGP